LKPFGEEKKIKEGRERSGKRNAPNPLFIERKEKKRISGKPMTFQGENKKHPEGPLLKGEKKGKLFYYLKQGTRWWEREKKGLKGGKKGWKH